MSTTEGGARDEPSRRDAAQAIARAHLANGATYAEAGREAGMSERTVARWMTDAAFARAVSHARAEQMSVATGQITSLAPDAVAALRASLASEVPGERLRAAQLVLSWSARLRRDGELEARLVEVESRLALEPLQ